MENVSSTHISFRIHQVSGRTAVDDRTHPVYGHIGSIVHAIQGGRQWCRCAAVSRQRSSVENITENLQNRRVVKTDQL